MARGNCIDTSEVVRSLSEEEVAFMFAAPKIIVYDKVRSFTAATLQSLTKKQWNAWRTVFSHAPTSIEKAKGMVGTIKQAIVETVQNEEGE